MEFNEELYMKYLNAAGIKTKDGIWDVTVFPNGLYCFATNQWLGINGRIDNHPLQGKKFIRKKDKKEYVIDSICIHWYHGYYYHATLRDQNDSHATVVIGNINCEDKFVYEQLIRFTNEYEQIK